MAKSGAFGNLAEYMPTKTGVGCEVSGRKSMAMNRQGQGTRFDHYGIDIPGGRRDKRIKGITKEAT